MVDAASRTERVTYPWIGTDDEPVVYLAMGSLRESLMGWLTTEQGVHAETLFVSIGAIAGFSAQAAIRERIKKGDVPGVTPGLSGPEIGRLLSERGLWVEATTETGEKYHFGDLLNGYLVQETTTLNPSLFAILAGAAISAGVKPDELPDMGPIFRYVASTLGTSEYGILHPPQPLSPRLTPREALDTFWPRVKSIFERTDGQGVPSAKGRNAKPEYWPMISASVARQFLLLAKDTINPKVGLSLIMESAIAMSKIDPKTYA